MKKAVIFLLFLFSFCQSQHKIESAKIKTGADVLIEKKTDLLKDKTIGIVTNHTAVCSDGTHIVDTLFRAGITTIKTLFGPEHGIRGDAPDGHKIQDDVDTKTGIPTVSLYGKVYKPTPEMLEGMDYIIFDIQDIGARFYTYISTLYHVMDACAENNVGVIVLDRPNPINGVQFDGPIRHDSLKSFVAIAPVALQHGMTVGELATIFNEEGMLPDAKKANLTIIKMENYDRTKYFDELDLPWINPSPNMPNLDAALLYPGLCLLEGTNLSEGRGTYSPFLQMGAPYINAVKLKNELAKYPVEGISFDTVSYTPVSIPNMSKYPKFKNKKCFGLKFTIADRSKLKALELGVYLISSVRKLYPEEFGFRRNWLNKLTGVGYITDMIRKGSAPEEIIATWQKDVTKFRELRKKHLLY